MNHETICQTNDDIEPIDVEIVSNLPYQVERYGEKYPKNQDIKPLFFFTRVLISSLCLTLILFGSKETKITTLEVLLITSLLLMIIDILKLKYRQKKFKNFISLRAFAEIFNAYILLINIWKESGKIL